MIKITIFADLEVSNCYKNEVSGRGEFFLPIKGC